MLKLWAEFGMCPSLSSRKSFVNLAVLGTRRDPEVSFLHFLPGNSRAESDKAEMSSLW
jgi:hypothetical protein